MTDHFLVVSEPERDTREYEIEHPDDCPRDHDDSFVVGATFYRCNTGIIWAEAGEYGVSDISSLPVGRYRIWPEYAHTPSTPSGPEEWDAWLETEPT